MIIGWRRKRKIRECPTFLGASITEKKGDTAVGQPLYATHAPRSLILSSELQQDGESNGDRVRSYLTGRFGNRRTLTILGLGNHRWWRTRPSCQRQHWAIDHARAAQSTGAPRPWHQFEKSLVSNVPSADRRLKIGTARGYRPIA